MGPGRSIRLREAGDWISRGILLPPVSDGTPGYLAGAPHPCAHDDRRGAVTYACSTRCEMQSVSERGGSMAKLIYSAITSLDGYVADEDGNFDWAAPDEEVHTFINDLERPVGTYLYGQAIKAGVVDEWHLFLTPIAVGGGKRSLPDNVRLKLELLDERRFGNGVVHLCYRTRT